jgi:hypothetical protein
MHYFNSFFPLIIDGLYSLLFHNILMKQTTTHFDFAAKPKVAAAKAKYR